MKEKGVVESFLPLTAFHRWRTSVFFIYTHIYINVFVRYVLLFGNSDRRPSMGKKKKEKNDIDISNEFVLG